MLTIITIVKADYCLMSQLLLNILFNVTLPPYPSFFVYFKHTFATHPTKISHFSITVTSPPRDTACHPPRKKILNVHLCRDLSSPTKGASEAFLGIPSFFSRFKENRGNFKNFENNVDLINSH